MDESADSSGDWKTEFKENLPMLGHRNWVLVLDKAFPEQNSSGIEYIYVEAGLNQTLQYVLNELEASDHVSPVIYRDLELEYLTEEQVKGIDKFKQESEDVLSGKKVQRLLHEEVFKLLDESSEMFKIFAIKTNCIMPYTSVFIQLDCGYWTPEQEEKLRKLVP